MAGKEELEFEQIEMTDFRISKPFQTKNKDTIRVAITPGKSAIIMSNKKGKFPDVFVDVPTNIPPVMMKKGFWGRIWDAIKKVVKTIFGGIDVGPSCSFILKPKLDPKSYKVIGFELVLSCK
jgi:hypothetical protein